MQDRTQIAVRQTTRDQLGKLKYELGTDNYDETLRELIDAYHAADD